MSAVEKTAIFADHYLEFIKLLQGFQGRRVDMDLVTVAFAITSIRKNNEADYTAISSITGIPRETVRRKVSILEKKFNYEIRRLPDRTIVIPSYGVAEEFVHQAEALFDKTYARLKELRPK